MTAVEQAFSSSKTGTNFGASPRVSVVMPVHNAERFVEAAVASVMASSFVDWELLAINDGSTDNSVARINAAAGNDPRVRIITVPHGGVANARNAALNEARGELIANLDADDLMFPNRLQQQVSYLAAHPGCLALGTRALVIDENDRPQQVGVRYLTHADIDGAHLAGRPGAIWNPTAMFRKAAAVRVGGYKSDLASTGEDFDLWLRLAEIGEIRNLPDVLNCYRVHGRNISINDNNSEERKAIALATVARAFARRGILNRTPVRETPAPSSQSELLCDEALLLYFRGDRRRAFAKSLMACLRNPFAANSISAVRLISSKRYTTVLPALKSTGRDS